MKVNSMNTSNFKSHDLFSSYRMYWTLTSPYAM